MNREDDTTGFTYHLRDETLREYRNKPVAPRLERLYQGNLLRMHLPRHIVSDAGRRHAVLEDSFESSLRA